MFAIDTGQRENTQVFYGPCGHLYYSNKIVHHEFFTDIHLRCTQYYSVRCRATTSVRRYNDGQEQWAIGRNYRHSCVARDPRIRQERLLRHEILESCRRSPYENPRHLLNSIALRYPVDVAARVRISSFRFAMRRARLSRYPNIPHSLNELGALLEDRRYENITATEDFLDSIYSATVGPPGHQSIVFVSGRMLRMLRRAKTVFVDATFKTAPTTPANRQVYQIVTTVIPIVQALMETKTFQAYYSIIDHLKLIAPYFHPEEVVMDFENAQFQAWKAAFQAIIITGCYVHYVRAYRNHLGTMGMIRLMNRLPSIKRLLRCAMSIPLLPPDLMLRGLRVLRQKAQQWFDRPGLLDIYTKLLDVFGYVEDTWLTGWRSEIVCVYNRKNRTNHPCESANRLLAAEVTTRHPNAWVFIEGLRRYEMGAYTDYVALESGLRIGNRRKTTAILNDAAIKHFTQDLLQGEISIFKFLRRTSMRVADLMPDLMPPAIM